jgi:hypothetical protein
MHGLFQICLTLDEHSTLIYIFDEMFVLSQNLNKTFIDGFSFLAYSKIVCDYDPGQNAFGCLDLSWRGKIKKASFIK